MKEQTTVLATEINGEKVILMPITKLECIEDTASAVDTSADTDYIPIMDSADNGQMKKIAVGALLGGIRAVAEKAETAAQKAAETASDVASSTSGTAFSIAVDVWTEGTTPIEGCGYIAEIAASGVVETDIPDVYFDSASIKIASAAGVIPDTAADTIKFYAEKIPTAALSGIYYTKKGATT